jgi:hypothetical protein
MDKAVILEALVKADLVFQSRLSAAELSELAELWEEALRGMDEAEFHAGMRKWVKIGQFFPKPSQIIEAAAIASEEDRRARAANIKELPQPTERTPEQIAHFQAKCRELQDRLSGRKLVLLPSERRTPRTVTERDRMEA